MVSRRYLRRDSARATWYLLVQKRTTTQLRTSVYDRVYHNTSDNILGFGILSPRVVLCKGVLYTVSPVIKWAVVWDFCMLTTPGGIL